MKFTSRSVLIYIAVNFPISFIFLALAAITSNTHQPFSILSTQMSQTGSPNANPSGWFFFSIGLWYGGIIMIPLNLYFLRRTKSIGIQGHLFPSIMFILASIGTFMVGLFPTVVSYTMHLVSAVLGLGFYGLGFLIFFFMLLVQDKKSLLLPYAFYLPFVTFLILTQSISLVNNLIPADGTFLSLALWEWSLFFSIVFMVISFTYLLREKS